MKIGIMTFWWSEDNYGQILQCYALQKYLRDAGHDAYLIRYDPRRDYIPTPLAVKLLKALNPIKLFDYFAWKKRIRLAKIEQNINPRCFKEFRDKYIVQSDEIYYSYEHLHLEPPQADMYIVGSDQVWNFYQFKLRRVINLVHSYFLTFGSADVKRISYAASWGKHTIPQDFINKITPLLKRFNYISVREKSGIDICNKCNAMADWVPDPTLLLSSDIYRKIYNDNQYERPIAPYMLLYLLGNDCDYSIDIIKNWANRRSIEVIYITGNDNYDEHQKTFATIPQWLYLIDHAEYVITNSFHCCVFSSIFHKQFAAVPVKGSIAGMNSRLESLWELLDIPPRLFINNDFSVLDTEYPELSVSRTEQKSMNFRMIVRNDEGAGVLLKRINE